MSQPRIGRVLIAIGHPADFLIPLKSLRLFPLLDDYLTLSRRFSLERGTQASVISAAVKSIACALAEHRRQPVLFTMQRTRFGAGQSAALGPREDLAKRYCTPTFPGVDEHGNLGEATPLTANGENKIVTRALRHRSRTLKSAQQVRSASSQAEAHDSGDI
jgi:hypothetical protein